MIICIIASFCGEKCDYSPQILRRIVVVISAYYAENVGRVLFFLMMGRRVWEIWGGGKGGIIWGCRRCVIKFLWTYSNRILSGLRLFRALLADYNSMYKSVKAVVRRPSAALLTAAERVVWRSTYACVTAVEQWYVKGKGGVKSR